MDHQSSPDLKPSEKDKNQKNNEDEPQGAAREIAPSLL